MKGGSREKKKYLRTTNYDCWGLTMGFLYRAGRICKVWDVPVD